MEELGTLRIFAIIRLAGDKQKTVTLMRAWGVTQNKAEKTVSEFRNENPKQKFIAEWQPLPVLMGSSD